MTVVSSTASSGSCDPGRRGRADKIRTCDLYLRRAGGASKQNAGRPSRHSEISANLLNGLRSNFRDFSECALINHANHLDFDSAIPKWPPLLPRQPKVSWMIGQALAQFSKAELNPLRSLRVRGDPVENRGVSAVLRWTLAAESLMIVWEDFGVPRTRKSLIFFDCASPPLGTRNYKSLFYISGLNAHFVPLLLAWVQPQSLFILKDGDV